MSNTKRYREVLRGQREAWFEAQRKDLARTDIAIQHFCETHTFEEAVAKLSKYINFEESTECAEWLGGTNFKGYGWFGISLPTTPVTTKTVKAHRLMFAIFYGFDALPQGVNAKDNDGSLPVLDHICENPSCVNPLHLQVQSGAYNSQKAAWKRLRSA